MNTYIRSIGVSFPKSNEWHLNIVYKVIRGQKEASRIAFTTHILNMWLVEPSQTNSFFIMISKPTSKK